MSFGCRPAILKPFSAAGLIGEVVIDGAYVIVEWFAALPAPSPYRRMLGAFRDFGRRDNDCGVAAHRADNFQRCSGSTIRRIQHVVDRERLVIERRPWILKRVGPLITATFAICRAVLPYSPWRCAIIA